MNIDRIIEERGLPCNLDAERAVLGSILLGHLSVPHTLAVLSVEDFSVENHRCIFAAMETLHGRVESINYVTVANELSTRGALESYGTSYLCSLTDRLPELLNVGSYLRIVKDKSIGRQGILLCQHLMNELASQIEPAPELLRRAELLIRDIGGQAVQPHNMRSPAQIIDEAGGVARFLEPQSSVGVLTP
jgi:replicative DNA helicase